MEVTLVVIAAAFALVNGANDGGALLSVGLKLPATRAMPGILPWVAVLAAAVVLVPLVVGTGVATTLVNRLTGLDGDSGRSALAIAVVSAVAVTTVLARRGLPTSLTLALVGGIVGVGLGGGLPVAWPVVAGVLAVAAVAPPLAAAAGGAALRALAVVRTSGSNARLLARLHLVGFALIATAYGANDGQKMLAVAAVAAGTAAGGVEVSVGWALVIAALFAIGTVIGLPRIAATVDRGVIPLRPPAAAAAEIGAGVTALGAGALGSPVSLTQAVTGGLVGTAFGRRLRRVRWPVVFRLAAAWVLTLPAAVGIAALVAGILVR